MNLEIFDFTANNSVYHIVKGLIFNRRIAFRVRAIFPDRNDRNLPIQNLPRLKERLFLKIKNSFNMRLEAKEYQFKEEFKARMKITPEKKDIFKIQLFQLASGMTSDDDVPDIGGEYAVYPLTFVCKECGDLQVVRQKNLDNFNPAKCYRKGCKGQYEQLSLMLFCETCGNVRPFEYSFNNEPITLIRGSKDSISTWKVRARTREPIDVFRLPCNHWDPFDFRSRNPISHANPSQQKTLTITEGSIFIPIVDVSIDIPTSPDIDIKDLEHILIGISLGKFDFLLDNGLEPNLKTIQELYNGYHNESTKKVFLSRPPFSQHRDKTEEEIDDAWKAFNFIDKIEDIVESLQEQYPKEKLDTLQEINDFSALLGKVRLEEFNTTPYQDYLESIKNSLVKQQKTNEFQHIKDSYFIDSIIHIPNITLISSCYGVINGINQFYEPGFIPHFDPIWIQKNDPNKGFSAYSYPYETEGIVLTLDKEKIITWLLECKIIDEVPASTAEFFNSLGPNDLAYLKIKTLLHTLSHLLMRNSSVYTGLDLQSYGEKIFPTSAAIFLFSTSSINIGGLQFIFENELFNWFENIKYDIKECTLDPNCRKDKGACFSCMFVPEFVCSEFNLHLSRNAFLGNSNDFLKGFWW